MRPVPPLAIALAAAALLAGCGSSSSEQSRTRTQEPPAARTPAAPVGASTRSCETYAVDASALRVTGASCREGRRVLYGWSRHSACSTPTGASRPACTIRDYRCLGARTARGTAVSCAQAGRSISFVAKRR